MRIDLHTHSNRSDGTTSPSDLVRHASEVGIDVLGLTDHDTTEGWDEAADVADADGEHVCTAFATLVHRGEDA